MILDATLPDDAARDGAHAVEIMRELVGDDPTPDPEMLEALAAALAEAGDFAQAVEVGDRALRGLRAAGSQRSELRRVARHLQRYREHRPVREP